MEDFTDEKTNCSNISIDSSSSYRSQRNTSSSNDGSVASVPSVTAKTTNAVNGTSYSLSSLDTALIKPSLRSTIDSILSDIEDLKNSTTTSRNILKHKIVRLSKLLEADNDDDSIPPVEASRHIWWENECGTKVELYPTKIKTTIKTGSVEHQEGCPNSTNRHDQEEYCQSLASSASTEYDIFNSFVPFDEEAWTILKSKAQNSSR